MKVSQHRKNPVSPSKNTSMKESQQRLSSFIISARYCPCDDEHEDERNEGDEEGGECVLLFFYVVHVCHCTRWEGLGQALS